MNRRNILTLLSVAALFFSTQITALTPWAGDEEERQDRPPASEERDRTAQQSVSRAVSGTPLDMRVDREKYRLDPGDRVLVSLWGATNKSFELVVTPEGDLLVPAVGPVAVARLSLAEAERTLARQAANAYRNTRITLSLVALREFRVHVAGTVKRPGTYLGTPADRVSSVIRLAGGFADSASMRRIQLLRTGLPPRLIDLQMFSVTGDTTDNPSLEMGDVITVPVRGDSVSVWGAVRKPGGYEYRPGDTVLRLIRLAGGLRDDAQTAEVEWSSFPVDSAPTVVNKVSLDRLIATGSDTVVRPGDRLMVYPVAEWRRRQSVTIEGEVRFPGEYSIIEGKTRISDVIARAGGPTRSASLVGSRILRRRVQAEPDQEFLRLSRMPVADMKREEYAYFKARSRELRGYLSIDVGTALESPGGVDDAPLVDGDLIVIKRARATIEVAGQVRRPGLIEFDEGRSTQFYIEQAGGVLSNAHRRGIRVIKQGTGLWVKPSADLRLEPGDTIFVPEKESVEWWELFKEGLLVVSQIATTVFIIQSVVR
ncbi:MAG TPA: SLBB domain-containing protein [Candidatus Latescibacteria bacterium]|nr:SLBB domain-containing protein [Candidatus Latescibacterota bacterium]HOS63607.1 SLBB domain-containing protein [Candidatus Latescibacterota bacterium]HPK73357.1 SLBB domain-containing protein [Candidatus Latescibacterota bacterium]